MRTRLLVSLLLFAGILALAYVLPSAEARSFSGFRWDIDEVYHRDGHVQLVVHKGSENFLPIGIKGLDDATVTLHPTINHDQTGKAKLPRGVDIYFEPDVVTLTEGEVKPVKLMINVDESAPSNLYDVQIVGTWKEEGKIPDFMGSSIRLHVGRDFGDGKIPINMLESPLKFWKVIKNESGNVDDVPCRNDYILVVRHDGSPACLTMQTKEKLIERGWTITVHTSEDFAKQSTVHEGKNNISKMHVLYSVKKPLDSFETDSFHFMHYEDWDYDFLWKAARYGATYLTDDEKDHYENTLKQNGTTFKMTNHKGPSYYEMKLVEEYLPVESDLIKFTEYPSDIIEKYGDDMLSRNLGSTGFDKESEDLWVDAMQKPYEWTEVTERGGAFAYNRIGPGFPYFQMDDGTWVQLYYLGPRMDNHSLFDLYAQGYGSEHPLEGFSEQTDDYPLGSKVMVRDREGSVSLTISVSYWEEYEQFRTGDNSKEYPPPVKITDESMHFVYFDMLLELNTPKGFAETPGRPDEYRKNIDKDYPIHSHREIYDWLRLESGKQYGYSAGGDIPPFFEYRDRLYRISSAIID